jgi:dihydrofolate synthase/folylpolyglutamate synthase
MDSQGSGQASSAAARLNAVLERLGALTDWERRGRRAGMRVDTAPIAALCGALGHPERGGAALHVAGSKGKGSTCAWLEAGLRAAGWRTGRYASPHLESVTERVAIDGAEDDEARLAAALERVLSEVEAGRERPAGAATWFDVLTAAAFLRFSEERCDWRVVEVGLGGRLDSTNVLLPELCLITSIELEHTEVLGDTREAIAAEKAGILKPGVPAIAALAPDDPAGAVVVEVAQRVGAPLVLAPPGPTVGLARRNRDLAARALEELGRRGHRTAGGVALGPELLDGQTPRLPGRLERGSVGGVPVVLDGAHTPGSLALLRAELEGDPELPGRPDVVFALGADKDVEGALKVLTGWADRVHCSSAGPRACAPVGDLAETARAMGLEAETASNPREAFQRALGRSTDRWVLVTGSLHLCGALRAGVQPRKAPCSRSSPTSS